MGRTRDQLGQKIVANMPAKTVYAAALPSSAVASTQADLSRPFTPSGVILEQCQDKSARVAPRTD